jgi:hypothetical protein
MRATSRRTADSGTLDHAAGRPVGRLAQMPLLCTLHDVPTPDSSSAHSEPTCGAAAASNRFNDGPPLSWPSKYVVGADPPPDDVRLTGLRFVAVLKRRAAVGRPPHLPDLRGAVYPLDTKARINMNSRSAALKAARCAGVSRR